ncbi:MAG: sugar phosphate isomerase/epimerase [Planctomycetes bacterium]|nr:sugar phosphate isomerase/epimerase [Planctomycetota bacterium]
MMKLSLLSHSYLHGIRSGRMKLKDILDRASEFRLDGVDLLVSVFPDTEPETLRQARMDCLRRGLNICYLGVSNDFGKPASELAGQVQLVKKWIDVAERMGVPMVRIFAAWIPQGEPEEAVWNRMMPCMREVAEYGEEHGVLVGLHNHNHGCVTRTGADVLRILDEVGNPYFTHILDTGQYAGSPGASGSGGKPDPRYDFYASIAQSAPKAVHIRCKIYRIQTGVEAWLDYDRIFAIINRLSYNGYLSVVYEGQDAESEETAVPKAVTFLRRYLR